MSGLLLIGVIIALGFIGGKIAERIRLPKVTGFILMGVLLNPTLLGLTPKDFTQHTDVVINIALCFITFAVGGSLFYPKVKELGKTILYVTIFEGEFAFIATVGGLLAGFIFLGGANEGWMKTFIPLSLLLGCLASPTDPSATLAVAHEFKAKGEVTSTVLGVAAFDDVLGIINYSIAIAIAGILVSQDQMRFSSVVLGPAVQIFGGILLGAATGFAFNIVGFLLKNEAEGALIVLILAMLCLCFGIAEFINVDELLAVMAMGAIVVNFNHRREKIFRVLERYTDELIFVLFFTLSGMHLNFSVLVKYLPIVILFVTFRTIGKIGGAATGAHLARADANIKKYAWRGLIPQGGIVVGLALIIKQNANFSQIADIIISVIIGTTIIHEIIGPILSESALKKAGEIK
ncbi:MAG: cation:proton antiporter [Phycisphaerae bacterium]|nr:cation:proton antiporter [Phycisphaerae bacterium]